MSGVGAWVGGKFFYREGIEAWWEELCSESGSHIKYGCLDGWWCWLCLIDNGGGGRGVKEGRKNERMKLNQAEWGGTQAVLNLISSCTGGDITPDGDTGCGSSTGFGVGLSEHSKRTVRELESL